MFNSNPNPSQVYSILSFSKLPSSVRTLAPIKFTYFFSYNQLSIAATAAPFPLQMSSLLHLGSDTLRCPPHPPCDMSLTLLGLTPTARPVPLKWTYFSSSLGSDTLYQITPPHPSPYIFSSLG